MSSHNKNDPSMNNELNKFNLTFYERSIELWRIEEKCHCEFFKIICNFFCLNNITFTIYSKKKNFFND